MVFRFHRLRFEFLARESIHFPAHKSANIVRGAFGLLFRRIVCLPECLEPVSCPLEGRCPYEQIFAPIARTQTPSGFRDLPRPLVFRATHLDGRTFPAGARFHIDVHTFDARPQTAASLCLAFAHLATHGLGPRRGRAELSAAFTLGLHGTPQQSLLYGAEPSAFPPPLAISLLAAPGHLTEWSASSTLRVHFLTPTELKHEGRLADRPEAPILLARAFDRLESLVRFYGTSPAASPTAHSPLAAPSQRSALLSAAASLRIAQLCLRHSHAERQSSRTGQTHPLDGFVGSVDFQGPTDAIAAIRPWLVAAAFAGVGRQTVWGKGAIHVEETGSV